LDLPILDGQNPDCGAWHWTEAAISKLLKDALKQQAGHYGRYGAPEREAMGWLRGRFENVFSSLVGKIFFTPEKLSGERTGGTLEAAERWS